MVQVPRGDKRLQQRLLRNKNVRLILLFLIALLVLVFATRSDVGNLVVVVVAEHDASPGSGASANTTKSSTTSSSSLVTNIDVLLHQPTTNNGNVNTNAKSKIANSGKASKDSSTSTSTSTTTTTTTTDTNKNHIHQNINHKKNDTTSTMMVRPTGLRLVMVGDSLSRYMYLSLVHFLAYGHWAPRGHRLLEKVKDDDPLAWNQWLAYSHSVLGDDLEACDCYRYWQKTFKWYKHCENRYFFATSSSKNASLGDNHVTFITKFGGNPFHGHWDAANVTRRRGQQQQQQADSGGNNNDEPHYSWYGLNQTQRGYLWSFDSWSDLVDQYIARLTPKPNLFVFNQGHWKGHELRDEKVLQSLQKALQRHGIRGVYRTTTYRSEEMDIAAFQDVATRKHDRLVCQVFDCLNVSWTANVPEADYVDPVHFKAPIYNRMNRQFLQEILGFVLPVTESQGS